jgi:CRP/FNR family cyclic AMP-dependent transcriptional regulator
MVQNRKKAESFDIQKFLSSAGAGRSIAKFNKGQVIFSQDDSCEDVLYIQSGNAKLSIVNPQGKEAVLAIVGPGDFLGEGCIIGNPVRMATATAIVPLNAMSIAKKEMIRVLHDEPEFAGKFINYMLERNVKIEADLVDQLFNSSEKRLARALLILARYGKAGARNDGRQNIAGDFSRTGRDNAQSREFLHEQIQEAGVHPLRR